jgi:hypothetical protein
MNLITIRKKKTTRYYAIDLRIIEEITTISWKAKGIWMYLISRPDGWRLNMADLIARSNDGEAAVRAGVKELISVGLVEVTKVRDEKGVFIGSDWIVSEEMPEQNASARTSNPQPSYPNVENPHVDNPNVENRTPYKVPVLKNTSIKKAPSGSIPQTPLPKSEALATEKPVLPDAAFLKSAFPDPESGQPDPGQNDLLQAEPKPQGESILPNPFSRIAKQIQGEGVPELPPPVATAPPSKAFFCQIAELDEEQPQLDQLVAELVAAGVKLESTLRTPGAKDLALKYPERCRQQLDWLSRRTGIEDRGAYLATAIDKDFSPPSSVKAEILAAQHAVAGNDAEAALLTVMERAKTHRILVNSKGDRLPIKDVRRNGFVICRDDKIRNDVSIPAHVALNMTWEAA